jgi:DNA-binding NarL/FixJ family response regulator
VSIRVLVVDDEPLVRSGLRAVLGSEPDIEVVGEAGDGADVPAAVRECAPTVVLMDVRMPRIDGIAATERLAAAPGAPRVLVVTTFENDEFVFEALRAGASGFLLKRARPEEIVQAVRTVAAGESLLFPDAIRSLVRRHGGRGDSGAVRGRLARLTEREGEILRLMARGLSNAEIAAEVYLGVETVKTHVGSVLAKLEVRDRTQAVVAAYQGSFVHV